MYGMHYKETLPSKFFIGLAAAKIKKSNRLLDSYI